MDIFDLLNLIGGLALFLYGMNTMGNALSKMAGGKLESLLEKLTSKKFFAVLLGAGVTAIIQSSSATTVMVVGFVNSGIMKLSQAVGIIMGANIGTTITSWILSLTGIEGSSILVRLLKPSSFTPILAAIGIILLMTSGSESKKKDTGTILLGFAILMFGMDTMSKSVAGLAANESFTGLMTLFSNPILGLIVGAALTAIIQSSSASVGILQALCLTGSVNYATAFPIIMGQNIGTCVTSIISSIGASKNARRAAMIHLYFNIIGTALFMILFYGINSFVDFAFMSQPANGVGIAFIHSIFNIGATIILYPFSNVLVKLSELTIPSKSNTVEKNDSFYLDERFLGKPAFAMELCRARAREMAVITHTACTEALDVLGCYNKQKAAHVFELEDKIDNCESILGLYLVKLSSRNISIEDSKSLSLILHSISDFERISDHARDIVISAQEMHSKGLGFSESACCEVGTLSDKVREIIDSTTEAFRENDLEIAAKVDNLDHSVDVQSKVVKANHIRRLQKGTCSIEMGFILEDVLNSIESISDHCTNIAIEMITIYDKG